MSDTPKCPGCDNEIGRTADGWWCSVAHCPVTYLPQVVIDKLYPKLAPQPVGDGVEIKRPVFLYQGNYIIGYEDETAGPDEILIAWLTARIPLPQVPTVSAKVEPIGGESHEAI